MESKSKEKVLIVGAGPVGALAGLYAAAREYDVEIYELRGGAETSISQDQHVMLTTCRQISEKNRPCP